MFEGDECYSSIKVSLARMFMEGHLKDTVEVTLPDGSQCIFKVRWHLCADFKLVSLATGLGGASAGHPCFLCFWDYSDSLKPAAPRTIQETERQAGWAADLQQPIQAAEQKLKSARATLQRVVDATKQRGLNGIDKGNEPDATEARVATDAAKSKAVDAVTAAKQARDQAVAGVLADINKFPPDHPLLKMWSDASWLQSQCFILPQAHYIDVTDQADLMQVSEEVHGIWTMWNATAQLIEQLQTSLEMCRDQLEAAPSPVKQSEWADQQLKGIDDTEENGCAAADCR
jgi:hypothetical protein